MESFDLIIIGAGPGGYVAAIRAAQLGLKVACIEKESRLGGTCLRVGCIPSKALLESSFHFFQARNDFQKHGILMEGVKLDLEKMQRRKRQIVSILTKGVKTLFLKNKIYHLTGTAFLEATNIVRIRNSESESYSNAKSDSDSNSESYSNANSDSSNSNSSDSNSNSNHDSRNDASSNSKNETRLIADSILIATGSLPAHLSTLPFDEKQILSSTEALELEEVPKSLAVVGGGFIGLELGSVWNRLGSKVSIIEATDEILPQMDRDLATQARRLLSKQGLSFKMKSKVCQVKKHKNESQIFLDNGEMIFAEKVLVSVGRVPCSSNLGLEALGVKIDRRGCILTDSNFATNVKGIYALGDVRGGAMLAHKAAAEAVAFAENLVNGKGNMNYECIPSVVFTDPQIASIGETEQALIAKNQGFHKAIFPYRANGRARISGRTEGFVKLLTEKDSGRILGAHLIGDQAGELINELALTMHFQQGTEELARSPFAHPTFGEVLQEAALLANGRGIHH